MKVVTITQPGGLTGVQDFLQRTHFPVELQVLPFPDPLPRMSSLFLLLTPPPTGGAFVVSISWGNHHGILLGLYFFLFFIGTLFYGNTMVVLFFCYGH